jgi:hypothetical protein
MNRLINAHIQFMKYNLTELKKKKPLNEHIKFIIKQVVTYGKFLFQLYKGLFQVLDPNYQKRKAEFKKQEEIKKQIRGMIKLLRYSKDRMRKLGMSRQVIRRFFLNMGADDKTLQQFADDLTKEIGG